MLASVFALSVAVYYIGAATPSIFEDEWFAVSHFSQDQNMDCPSSANLFWRPLQGCYYRFIYAAWGINVGNYHTIMLGIRAAVSVAMMALLLILVPNKPYFVFGVALLFSFYPTTFMWPMFNLGHIYLSYLAIFVACYFFATFARSETSLVNWILGVTLMCLSLLLYEAGLGLLVLISGFLLARYWPSMTSSKRLMVAAPGVLTSLFGIGRWMTQIDVASAFGHDTEQVVQGFTLVGISSRLSSGYWITLGRSWLDSVYDLFDANQHLPYRQLAPSVAIAIAVFGVLLLLYGLRHRRMLIARVRDIANDQQEGPIPWRLKELIVIILLGILAIGAGYIPALISVTPGISYGASRINFLPAAGGALSIITIFILMLKFAGIGIKDSSRVLSIFVICLSLLSSRTQIRSQLETIDSWQTQKAFWNELFREVPDIADGTQIILTLPEAYQAPVKFGAPPFAIYWRAFGEAMALMYGHAEPFEIFVVYGQGPEGIKLTDGSLYVPSHLQQITPVPISASQTVVLNFFEVSGDLQVLQELVTEEGESVPLCQRCVGDRTTVPSIWRYLVAK